ncbi:ADP-ribosylglycohydrolase family protein [Archangium primigenium]|uniref:ADP-ribosylglycohydrolase family protein n=1 Tax=[Archangium] primigenium TaxID=2792470 RepID=UPI0019599CAA|nr:ADP-ribosylglycohydrolase family protein [Archangium primigenium]MBM7115763.1 ADP-ribosylglycohydrolase family protein [Archangium primigenium]
MPPRRPIAPAAPDPHPRSRGRGALMGLVVGDALGSPLKSRNLLAPVFPTLAEGVHRVLRAGGPFELKKGQVGESGQMACCLGVGLRELGTYDANEQLRHYLRWQRSAQGMSPFTEEVMTELLESSLPKALAARRVWLRGGRKVALNGSLARTAPLGVYFYRDQDTRLRASFADSALTHFDPRCQLACATLNASIAHALGAGEGLDAPSLLTATLSELTLASAMLGRLMPDLVYEISVATATIREDLDAARQDDPQLYWPELHMHRKPTLVRVALRLAYWELLHAPTFEAALVDVINRGGDADVNAAVTGALLGAFHGEEAIPSDWSQGVLDALGPRDGALWNTYHPRQLLTIAPEVGE